MPTKGLALIGAVLLLVASWAVSVAMAPPNSGDFLMLTTGSKLLGPDLYSWQKAAEVQRATEPRSEVYGFVRLPFEALVLWPLAQLPIRAGVQLWEVLNLCALLAFIWIWDPRPQAFLVAALFPPIWWAFNFRQESLILLLAAGLGILLIERNWDFAGGFLLALCSVKPHLFLFFPVLLLAQKRWRSLGGMVAGGATVYAISAVIVGLDWPVKFLASVTENRQAFRPLGPGLSAVFSKLIISGWMIVCVEIAAAVCVYLLVRRRPWIPSAVFVLAANIVLAPWGLFYDLTFFLPLLLSMQPRAAIVRGGSLIMLTFPTWPIAYPILFALAWNGRPRLNPCEQASRVT